MKKIILIIFLIFQTEMIFSQGELTSDSKYLENLKYKITEIVRTSIKEDKINYIKQEERNGGYSLVIEIWQDRNGNICKVKFNHIGKGLYTKKELRKIRKKIMALESLNIYVESEIIQYLTKDKYFSIEKYNKIILPIKLMLY